MGMSVPMGFGMGMNGPYGAGKTPKPSTKAEKAIK